MRKRWWKQSLSSYSKTNRLSCERCTIAQRSARLGAPSGTCFLLLCNPGTCFPACSAPWQLSSISPEGKKWQKKPSGANRLSELTPQSGSFSAPSFHRVQVPRLHLLRPRGGADAPKSPFAQLLGVRLQKSPRQALPILALALSQISWLMLGRNTGGFPNRRPPVVLNSPFASPNQNTLRRRWLTHRRTASARTRLLLKVHRNRFGLCVSRSASYSAPSAGYNSSRHWKMTLDEGNLRNYIFPLPNNYCE